MNKIVVLGAGHGLPDPGACGFVKEYQIVMQMTLKVKKVLERHKIHVILTRTSERSLSLALDLKQNKREDLERRVKITNESGAEFLIEFHMNAGGGTGYETLCYSKNDQIQAIHTAISNYLRVFDIHDRGIKIRKNLRVLQVKPKAAVLEMLFVDHSQNAKYMADSVFQNGLAEAIAQGTLAAIGIA
ncbi:N-acetylmuramoyl-L-alanine amidase [Brevibacillus laterosporus]|nr:N-acetylmuramoyl-L-alanine amidase [Brevibacillus laterosporus]RAP26431.1 N-acetylmuramoyl-L-alanine amidase [Brevibacillus laterosporus]